MKNTFYLLLGLLFLLTNEAMENNVVMNNNVVYHAFQNREVFSLITRYLIPHEHAKFSMTSSWMYTHGRIRIQYRCLPHLTDVTTPNETFPTFVRNSVLLTAFRPQVVIRTFHRTPDGSIPPWNPICDGAADVCFTVSFVVDKNEIYESKWMGISTIGNRKRALQERFHFNCAFQSIHSRGPLEDVLAIFPCSPRTPGPDHIQPIHIPVCLEINESLRWSEMRYFTLHSIHWNDKTSLILRYIDLLRYVCHYPGTYTTEDSSISLKIDISSTDKPTLLSALTVVDFSTDQYYPLIKELLNQSLSLPTLSEKVSVDSKYYRDTCCQIV